MLSLTLVVLLAAGRSAAALRHGPAPASTEQDDAARFLRELSSQSAELRAEAGRWLTRHLATDDFDAVLAATLRGDAESNRRLLEALSDDDQHLALAVALAARTEDRASQTGRGAILEMIARWSSGHERAGLAQEELLERLAKRSDERRSDEPLLLDARGRAVALEVALDELARFATAAPALVLAPGLAGANDPRTARTALTGRFDRVLAELALHHGARIEGFGFDENSSGETQPWIHVFPARAAAVLHTGGDLLVDWCLASTDARSIPSQHAAARALASTGWPAALTWFESRWRASADLAALDGLLLAARRGRVAPVLFETDVQRDLYARMARASSAASTAELSLAQDIARALAAAGPSSAAGDDLRALAIEGFDAAPPRERWLRLVVLEADGRASAAACAVVDATVAAPVARATPPALRFQALRARAAGGCGASSSSGALAVAAGGRELLEWADASGDLDLVARVLRASRTRPSDDLRDPRGLSDDARAVALEWWFAADERDIVAENVGLWLSDAARSLDALAARARSFVQGGVNGGTLGESRAGGRERWRDCLENAQRRSPLLRDAIEQLAIQSGVAADEVRTRWLGRWLADLPSTRAGLLGLAALVVGERGVDARQALIDAIRGRARPEDIADALSRAWLELVATRQEDEERAFIKAVRAAARDASPPLRARLRVDLWPGRPPARPLSVSEFDRRLDLAGL